MVDGNRFNATDPADEGADVEDVTDVVGATDEGDGDDADVVTTDVEGVDIEDVVVVADDRDDEDDEDDAAVVVAAVEDVVVVDTDPEPAGDEPVAAAPDDATEGLEERISSLIGQLAAVVERQVDDVRAAVAGVDVGAGSAQQVAEVIGREVRRRAEEVTTSIRDEMRRLEAKLDAWIDSGPVSTPTRSRAAAASKSPAKRTAAKKAVAKKSAAKQTAAKKTAAKKTAAKKTAPKKTAAKKAVPTKKAAAKKATAKKATAKKAVGKIAVAKKAARGAGDRKNIWVTREEDEGAWAVRRENSPRRLGTFRTQAEAKSAGRDRAERDRVELIWQGRDGKIAGSLRPESAGT
jgi:hypothetical protein